jgi:pimeloyl-ACP methyl ester carboxylesterase
VAIAIVIVTGVVGAVLLVNSLQGTVLTTSAPAPTAGPAPAPPGTSSENGDPRSCDAAAGSSRFDTEFTGADGQPVPYSVSLPADYYTECREYPVLFALHGRDQNNATFLPQAEELRGAVDAGVLDDVVIVTPDSDLDGRWEGRHSTTFIDELVPHIEQSYRVQTGSAYRLLVGWSMGGHGAFQFGIEHPEMFAAVWAVDGAMSREPTDYLKFLNPAVADDLKITSVGGNLNGDRVEEVINLFARHGVELPYERLPLDHEFTHFVQADRDAGWPTMTWMNAQLSQSP